MYIIFDCTKRFGHAAVTRSKWSAHLLAMWLSWRTGRFHDYDPSSKTFARLRLSQRQDA